MSYKLLEVFLWRILQKPISELEHYAWFTEKENSIC